VAITIGGSSKGSNLNNRISNAETRISASGFSPDVDNRNFFEKATNLEKNQNWFFDLMDLIERPFQGASNTVHDQFTGSTSSIPNSFWRGFSGKKEVSGADLMKDFGVESKAGQFLGGLATEIFADPVNLIPGVVFAKPFVGAAKLGKATAKHGINLADSLVPGAGIKEGTENFLSLFNRDRGLTQVEIDIRNQKEADLNYYQRKILDQNLHKANKAGLDNGDIIAREMEKDLDVSFDVEEIVKRITANKPNQDFKVNKMSPELTKFIDDINKEVKSSPEFIARLNKEKSQLSSVNKELAKTFAKYDIPDIAKRINNGGNVSKLEQKVFRGVQTKNRKKKEFEKFINNFKPGIKVNSLDSIIDAVTGKKRPRGYEIKLANPGIIRQILGKEDVIDKISPKRDFTTAINNDPQLRQIVDGMIRSGKAQVPKANTQLLDQLKGLFGDDVRLDRRGPRNDHIRFTDKGKKAYATVNSADEIEFIDRIQNIKGQRPDRNYIDPLTATKGEKTIRAVAGQMLRSNNELSQLAKDNNIDIKELEGYMTHIWSEETKANNVKAFTPGKAPMGGNDALLKNRKHQGSVEDVNELKDKNFFQMNAFFATAIGQKRLAEYVVAESFKDEVLAAVGRKYMGGSVGKEEVVITPDRYQFFKTDGGQMSLKKGESFVVPKRTAQMLDNFKGRIQDDGIKNFARWYDSFLNVWKNFVLLSPGYHVRNDIGSGFNMWIAGMRVDSIAKYKSQSIKDILSYRKVYANLKKDNPKHKDYKYYDEFRREGMFGTSFVEAEFKFAGDEQEKAFMKALEEGNESQIKKLMPQNWFKSSREIAQFVDSVNKLAMYKWLREVKGLSVKQSTVKVKETLFDYNDLTEFEQQVMRKVFPFYTWMKKNAVFQVKNLIEQPKKYYNFNKLLNTAYEVTGVDQENVPDWMREHMHIPFMKGDKKGDASFFNAGLPASDLGRLSDPIRMLMEGITPAVKMPYEWNANYNSFIGMPIEEFEGQTKNLLGADIPAKLDHFLRGFGLPNILDKAIKGNSDPTGMTRYFDSEKAQTSKDYEKLRQLEDYIKLLQQQGNEVPTIRELNR
jgi:hypothetical protein